jgi:hypothetical protein
MPAAQAHRRAAGEGHTHRSADRFRVGDTANRGPISTVIMLRSIGDIARAESEDTRDPETALSLFAGVRLGLAQGRGRCRE